MIEILADLFGEARHSVTHLEMRDTYGTRSPDYRAWREGMTVDQLSQLGYVQPWVDLVRNTVSREVSFRRARIISEPASEYIRFEHAVTGYCNLAGGERVRWLPRSRAADLAVPGADFWQIDSGLVCFVFQSGDGEPSGYELTEDAAVAKLCDTSFETVWERGIDHSEFRLT